MHLENSSRGYLYLGKSDTGQAARGTSILWMYLEWVQAREAAVRPWKPPWNDNIERLGVPGASLIIHDSISSLLNPLPSLILFMYLKCINLKAFSLEQEPHIMVVTWKYLAITMKIFNYHLVEAGRGGGQEDVAELHRPVTPWVHAQGGSVGQDGDGLGGAEGGQQGRVVVT